MLYHFDEVLTARFAHLLYLAVFLDVNAHVQLAPIVHVLPACLLQAKAAVHMTYECITFIQCYVHTALHTSLYANRLKQAQEADCSILDQSIDQFH
jgi:hypothetical protein